MAIDIRREGVWDVSHKEALTMCRDEVFYFDPELSYETTGYRPITETKGLDFDPAPFTEVGRFKDDSGKYTNIPWGTKSHRDWWLQQYHYCEKGFEHNGYRITNDHYFFLNFYTMLNGSKVEEAGEGIADSRPDFWAEHYKYFHYIDMCRKLGFDSVLLKARGVGASETAASLGVRPFITTKNSKSLFTAFSENFVKGVLGKCWKQLNWLDMNTETAMLRLRQVVNSSTHKRASQVDKTGIESGRMAEMMGLVIDNSDKLRGDRVDNWFLEESGSNDILLDTYAVGEALVIVNGKRRGTRFVFGTGGCLCAGSKVMLNNGCIINIEDITKEDGVIGHDFKKATRENINYMHTVSIKPCVRIVTKGNRVLDCSTDHPIYSKYSRPSFKGQIDYTKFLEAGKLKLGDKIAIPRFVNIFGKSTFKNAELIGELIGVNYHSLKGIEGVEFLDKKLSKQLSLNKILEDGGIRQVIPTELYSSNKLSLSNFLRGVIKSDCSITDLVKKHGNIIRVGITIRSVDRNFIEELILLLQKIGVNSAKMKHKCTDSYNGETWSIIIKEHESLYNLLNTIDVTGFCKLTEIKEYLSTKTFDNDPLIYEDVVYIEDLEYKEVYNLEASTTNTYLGNGILTHNSKGPALKGLKSLFLDPRAYSVLPYRNNFVNSGDYVLTGFFIPAWATIVDAMDNRGVVNTEEAKEHYYKKRAKLAGQPAAFIKHCAEYCFTHEEALSQEGQNDFNQALLATQRSEIEHLKRTPTPEKGYLHWVYKGKDSNDIVGVRWEPNPLGDIEISEHPLLDEDSFVIKNLYVGGIDSIDVGLTESTEGDSKFCILIKKRTFGTGGNQYVCKYLKRPNDVREAYGVAARILWYYDCKANLEETKIGLRTWLREKRWDSKMLMNRPVYALTDARKRNMTLWGTPGSPKMIIHGLELVRDYVEDYCHLIYYIDIIDQLQKYSYEGKTKFDIIAAMCMAEIGDEDMYNLIAKRNTEVKTEWRDVGYYNDDKGIKHYGIIPRYDPANTDMVKELKKQGYKF